jgi:hypothetical protein
MLTALYYDIKRQGNCIVSEEGLHNVQVTKYLNLYSSLMFSYDMYTHGHVNFFKVAPDISTVELKRGLCSSNTAFAFRGS